VGSRQLETGNSSINLGKFFQPISQFIRRVKDSKGIPLKPVAVYKRGKPMAKEKKKIQIKGANRQ